MRSQLVWWTVPGSGGRRVQVHEDMLPSLQEVAANLSAHAAQGRHYSISSVGAFVPRTIGGRHQISRHALGQALDINPHLNPFRGDGKLITNMPSWFVDSWTSEGFCWGGDWGGGSKDPMHFSWMGPAATPSSSDGLDLHPPNTSKTDYSLSASHQTLFEGEVGRYNMAVADGSGNGASDVMGVRSHPSGSVIDVVSSTRGFGECSVFRWFLEGTDFTDSDFVLFADINGDSGQDLISLNQSGSNMTATIATRGSRFEDVSSVSTGIGGDAVAVTGGDFDGDHLADLWEVTPGANLRIWRGPDFDQLLSELLLPGGVPSAIAVGDRDGGNRPELFALYPGSGSRVDVLTLGASWSVESSFDVGPTPPNVLGMAGNEYDGDGRADVQILDSDATLHAYVGNSSIGVAASRWFLNPSWECSQEHPVVFDFFGTFFDDEGNIFESDIESIAAVGVTRGCNPPFNDIFCPKDVVTRETMAAFLVRGLGLTQNSHPGFVDVSPGSTFAQDIGRLATAGITKGCNPPKNDRFCPRRPVTRETMAAFIVRALDLTNGDHAGFVDVQPGSTFREDIRRLAAAGITRGCNPPANDLFCPKNDVTRETMAAFLRRAGLGG